jgi:hypothetical protein
MATHLLIQCGRYVLDLKEERYLKDMRSDGNSSQMTA